MRGVHSRVIFVLNNDAEGVDVHARMTAPDMLAYMTAMRLPDHSEFRSFPAGGPEELFIRELTRTPSRPNVSSTPFFRPYGPPQAVWSNCTKELHAWQGAPLKFSRRASKIYPSYNASWTF
ncbi:hypothetical protein SAMN05216328_12516 [Ensifer sp. YR511]|nr:hypothetical protein SAMN05216328_12516 [Ensifer sp. YR511]